MLFFAFLSFLSFEERNPKYFWDSTSSPTEQIDTMPFIIVCSVVPPAVLILYIVFLCLNYKKCCCQEKELSSEVAFNDRVIANSSDLPPLPPGGYQPPQHGMAMPPQQANMMSVQQQLWMNGTPEQQAMMQQQYANQQGMMMQQQYPNQQGMMMQQQYPNQQGMMMQQQYPNQQGMMMQQPYAQPAMGGEYPQPQPGAVEAVSSDEFPEKEAKPDSK